MNIQIRSATLTSDEQLHALIVQSLDRLLGSDYELIAAKLPLVGNHILTLDADHKPVVISYNHNDGGHALLSGIGVVEKLVVSRDLLCQLYPRLSEVSASGEHILTSENIRLMILTPESIPGTQFLTDVLSNISVYTYQQLQIDDDIGLLIEPAAQPANTMKPSETPAPVTFPEFRIGRVNLNEEEERFFQEI
jgi:hypothetical protein